jgi:hypothetical protein
VLLALGVSLGVHALVVSSLSDGKAGGAAGSRSETVKVRLLARAADLALDFPQGATRDPTSASASPERVEQLPMKGASHRNRLGPPASVAQEHTSAGKADLRVATMPATVSGSRIYAVDELDVLPSPAGEPLVDLREFDDAVLDGSVELVLLIDPTGRVIDEELSGGTGLPIGVVDVLQRSFKGFPYVPGQVRGTAVHSRVRLQIALRDGRTSVQMNQ